MKYLKLLYIQVLIGIAAGVIVGTFWPDFSVQLKPMADLFVALVKMLITPIIFFSLVSGILSVSNASKAGAVAVYSLGYFLLMSTFALGLGLAVSLIFQPGHGINIDPSTLQLDSVSAYMTAGKVHHGFLSYILDLVPKTLLSPLVEGNLLQTLVVALLFGFCLSSLDRDKKNLQPLMESVNRVFFKMMHAVLTLAPIAAFAAIGFTIGKFGFQMLSQLFFMMMCFYLTCLAFIFIVLGTLLWCICRISIFKLIVFLKEELLIVLATSSSETVLPNLIEKLEQLGVHPDVTRMVLPTGYSFNLDGTAIYLTLAALFIAQATQTHLSFDQILLLLGIMVISSKGSAAVTGGGFVTLAATLTAFGTIPLAGIVLILGIDRFMSEGRALTNVLGNSVATLLIATFLKELDKDSLKKLC